MNIEQRMLKFSDVLAPMAVEILLCFTQCPSSFDCAQDDKLRARGDNNIKDCNVQRELAPKKISR